MPSSTAAAPVFLAQLKLQRGHEENQLLAFDMPKAFKIAPHGALALLLRHMGVPEEHIRLFHMVTYGSTVRIVIPHGPTPSIRLLRGRAVQSALCSISFSWSRSCCALPARRRMMPATPCHQYFTHTATTSR